MTIVLSEKFFFFCSPWSSHQSKGHIWQNGHSLVKSELVISFDNFFKFVYYCANVNWIGIEGNLYLLFTLKLSWNITPTNKNLLCNSNCNFPKLTFSLLHWIDPSSVRMVANFLSTNFWSRCFWTVPNSQTWMIFFESPNGKREKIRKS